MQKYNQGFGCFGPMEKCDDGKWAKSVDAEMVIAECRASSQEFCDAWMKAIEDLSDAHLKIACLGVLTILGWGIIAVALAKYAFTGHIL